jgi:hypothetical protein
MGMVLIMAILSQAVLQNMYTEGRRSREDEMIWRGNQYVRAIRLYYRKTGHYPQTIDDLKSGMPELHFLRYSAYKDPMNKGNDGAWRFIYINASGQIIGSVRYASLQQMALMDLNGGTIPVNATLGSIGTPVSQLAAGQTPANNSSAPAAGQNGTGASGGASTPGTPGTGTDTSQQSTNGSPTTPQNATTGMTSSFGQSVNPLSLLKPTGPVDGPVLGGLLTGVGGGTESDSPSIKVVSGGKKYKDWEFIWNPLEDQARAMASGLGAAQAGIGIGATGAAGTSSMFGNPGSTSTGFGGALLNPPTSQPQQPSQP